MKNDLTGSLLHQKLQRAYPQGTFPETTLDVLSQYPENTDIDAKDLKASEKDIFIDLATCALIESKRSPIYKNGIFAGFRQVYRYRSDLNYTELKEDKLVNEPWFLILVFALGFAIGAWASMLLLLETIKNAHQNG